MAPLKMLQALRETGRRLTLKVWPQADAVQVLPPSDSNPPAPDVSPVRTYSVRKLAQVATDCGSTVAADQLGLLLADPRHSITSIAAALSTTPIHLAQALAKPEPIAYAPLSIN
jgi:hypothetical protein